MTGSTASSGLPSRRALRVPEITVYFWIIKGLSTAMGEATSDYLVHALHPVPAVLLGFVGFVVALALQFSMRRYLAWTYWFAVVMVGVFGTMAADVLHVGFGVPYIASSALYAVALLAVFVTWQKTEKTLSIHSVDTFRREAFYWATVVATFALGTAVGDLTASTFDLGYFFSASIADWLGKPILGGLGLGDGRVSLVLTIIIVAFVAYLARTRKDVQLDRAAVNGETAAVVLH